MPAAARRALAARSTAATVGCAPCPVPAGEDPHTIATPMVLAQGLRCATMRAIDRARGAGSRGATGRPPAARIGESSHAGDGGSGNRFRTCRMLNQEVVHMCSPDVMARVHSAIRRGGGRPASRRQFLAGSGALAARCCRDPGRAQEASPVATPVSAAGRSATQASPASRIRSRPIRRSGRVVTRSRSRSNTTVAADGFYGNILRLSRARRHASRCARPLRRWRRSRPTASTRPTSSPRW